MDGPVHDAPVGLVPRGQRDALGQVARDEGDPLVGELRALVEPTVAYEAPVEHRLVEGPLPHQLVLELGPVLTGLALSGRVGANIAAELGTMRVTEQIDALETLAYDPVAYLVVPRILAGVIMVPLVVILATATGIAAGWATALQLLDMSSAEFMRGLRLFFESWDVQFAFIKSLSFGFTITSLGCFFGFTTLGGAEGVGISTTRAVVVSSMVILVLDAFWAATLL